MKLIYKIALNEIRNLFYSPVAWFLGIAFWILCALGYTDGLSRMANFQEIQTQNNPAFEGFGASLTDIILLSGSLFSSVKNNLYFFLPLLTMGLIGRELNSGSIKLLYSSPIKPLHIVLGKYLAIVLYCLCLLAMLSIFLLSSLFSIAHVDGGLVISALIGLFLLICAYAAIGIFMSSLSTYQIVSGVATFLLIFVLTMIGSLWQQYDFVRDLTYFLSMAGRTERMLKGLVTTSDVLYFLLIIGMFLCFTYFKVKGAMESKSRSKTLMQYLAVLTVVLLSGYISSRPALIGYWDVTRDDNNTIHPNTQAVIAQFDQKSPLKVTLYVNLLGGGVDRGGLPINRKDYEIRLWEPYVRFKPDIQFDYVYYYDLMAGDSTLYKQFPKKSLKEIAGLVAKTMNVDPDLFISPEEIHKRIDLTPENKRVVMQLEYQGRKTFLRTFEDGPFWPDQMNIAAAFKRLQQSKLPKILFSTGNLERDIFKTGERDYYFMARDINNRIAFPNVGFECDSINLDKQDIPAGTDVLVLADPKTTLSMLKQAKIQAYLDRGGNALIVGEPGKQAMINPLLAPLGVQLNPGTLVELSKNETPDVIRPNITKEGFNLSDQFKAERDRLAAGKSVVQGSLDMRGTAEVSLRVSTDFKPLHILKTEPKREAYNTLGRLVIDSVPPVYTPAHGDTRKTSYTTLLGLSRKETQHEQRILIAGDADFLSTLRRASGVFSVSLLSWLDNNRLPVYAPRIEPKDVVLSISQTNAETQRMVMVYVVPVLILLTGTIILIRRKRK